MTDFMKKLLGINWKTTGSGIAAICTAIGDITHSISTHTPINWNVDVPAIIGGVGLIAAKDGSTHSTTTEVQKASEPKP
jgi:hypothetical protein